MPSAAISVAVGLLAVLLVWAVVTDLRSRRIPNKLCAAGILLAGACHAAALAQGVSPLAGPAWWAPLAGMLAGLALLLPLYLLGATGAGDVKLMAAVGAFIGVPAIVSAVLYTLLCGGLLSLVFMFGRGVAAQTLANVRYLLTDLAVRASARECGVGLAPLETTAARLPYAVAIALGTAAALIRPLGWFAAGAAS